MKFVLTIDLNGNGFRYATIVAESAEEAKRLGDILLGKEGFVVEAIELNGFVMSTIDIDEDLN